MKKLIVLLSVLTIFYSCITFQVSMDKSYSIFAFALIPDTCDISLIDNIRDYRIDKQKFPDNQDIKKLKEKLSLICQENIDSINTLAYKNDSMDFVFRKTFTDSTLGIKRMVKCYRLIFTSDTLEGLRIIHNNTKYKSELLTNK